MSSSVTDKGIPSQTLYVFNPEHDLCLANGDPNYVPPASALDFARRGVGNMRVIYGDDAEVIAADDFALWRSRHDDAALRKIVPWGWDARLKQTLLRQGADIRLLPSDLYIDRLRNLQHRSTVMPLQPLVWQARSAGDVAGLLSQYPRLVLKAPWSGSGRGLRWVDKALSSQDEAWIAKTVEAQHCVMVEVRYNVKENFAFEFYIEDDMVRLAGLSLFVTQSGVYRHNILLSDDEIRRRLNISPDAESALMHWIRMAIVPDYEGYLGIDLILTDEGEVVVSEVNLRHTMGIVAHQYLLRHPELEGREFKV